MIKKQYSPKTYLVVGSDKEGRTEKAEEILEISAEEKNNPDFFLLTSVTSIGIEEIRDLQQYLSLKPFASTKKAVFIEEAQNLTIEAQNALLKTLEEPPEHSIIVLSVPDSSWLLPTVVSRSQIIRLNSKSDREISPEESKLNYDLLTDLLKASIPKRLLILEEAGIAKDRQTALSWIEEMLFSVRQSLLENNSSSTGHFLNILKMLLKQERYLKANCNPKLVLENFLINLPSIQP